ncbi:hypothetical protein GIB67_019897 [Kingdonia uniflora]|uniref:Uncharacterized protein n=1 Tax=Kingdonia uniflora TaxID=39325 RepID=A0A7J7MKH2_9MAGN|nr:hypothetical protein GIB67_019897 [Kingdonia uniflora]
MELAQYSTNHLKLEEVVLQLKYGKDKELEFALLELVTLLKGHKSTESELVEGEGVIPILFNRLSSSEQSSNRLSILVVLRSLTINSDENKEKMGEVGFLSTLVRSLIRDAEESREAVGLLLSLSGNLGVRRRIGRLQGCIVMLVAMLNGSDPLASNDAEMLLSSLSSNTQDVLHMAEAGYFKPLVQHLKEGSDMSKILMATTLSTMELTDQSRATLGEVGSIEPLVKMFSLGNLEAKLSALGALQNISYLPDNIQRLIDSGFVTTLLQLLFSVTSVLMTLREPASAILASIAQLEGSIFINKNVGLKMLCLLNLSTPVVQGHLLQALESIASNPNAAKIRNKMVANGAFQILLPFLLDNKMETRTSAMIVLSYLSKDSPRDLSEQLAESENYLNVIVNIIWVSTSNNEKAAAVGLLDNLPIADKKTTNILKKINLIPILVSVLDDLSTKTLSPACSRLVENVVGVLIRFTLPTDKRLQKFSVEQGVVSCLVKILSSGSPVAKSRAATNLAQLSQSSFSLSKPKTSRWLCAFPCCELCEVHDGNCSVKTTFCLLKADAITPLVKILVSEERDCDEAVLGALTTLMQDEIWERGSHAIAKASGVEAAIRVLQVGNIKAQEKALWILERVFRVESHRIQYGEFAQGVLVDLTQKGSPTLKSSVAKILAHLELLQMQSSYF